MTNNADMKVTAQFALAPISPSERGLIVDALEFHVRNSSESEFTAVDFEYDAGTYESISKNHILLLCVTASSPFPRAAFLSSWCCILPVSFAPSG